MTLSTSPFRGAVPFLLISAVLHILAPLVGGLSMETLRLILVGLIYVGFAAGLARGWRWLAYVVFFGVFIGAIVALGFLWTPGGVPDWWWWAIIAADLLVILTLFVALWRSPVPKDV